MSTIVHANEADATAAMASGQMVANSISVAQSFSNSTPSVLRDSHGNRAGESSRFGVLVGDGGADCQEDQKFLNWDIPMSTIVHANEADATAAMASGQMVANWAPARLLRRFEGAESSDPVSMNFGRVSVGGVREVPTAHSCLPCQPTRPMRLFFF
jgi:hypothetical protein